MTGVLECRFVSFVLSILVYPYLCAFHCCSNTVQAVASALSKSVPPYQLLRPIKLSISSSGVLVLSFSERTFPSQSVNAAYNCREHTSGAWSNRTMLYESCRAPEGAPCLVATSLELQKAYNADRTAP